MCRVSDRLSAPALINRNIIQGCGVGSTLYAVVKSDMNTVGSSSLLIKCADDVDLIVPETSNVDIATEFNHMKQWATNSQMDINLQKTKEMVFHRPNPRTQRALSLSVQYWSSSSCEILSVYSQRMYLLKLLKARGLPIS